MALLKSGWVYGLLIGYGLAGSVSAHNKPIGSTTENDSLVNVLRRQLQLATYDSTRVVLNEKLSSAYLATNNYDSAFASLQHGLQLAIKGQHPLDLGRMYRALGYYYDYRRISPQHIDASTKAVRFFQQAGRITEAADAQYFLSKICVGQGLYDKAIEQLNKSLAYARQTGYYGKVGSSYCLLYELHKSLGQKKRAWADLQALQKAAIDYYYPIDMYLANTSFAEWYAGEANYTIAVGYLIATVPIMQQLNRPNLFVMLNYEIATNLMHLKRFSEADVYIDKAFEEAKKDKLMSQDGIYITLARLREQQNRLPEAYQAALIAVGHAREKHPYLAHEYLQTLLSIQEKQGHYQESLTTLHELYALNDSLKDAKNAKAIELAESRFALDKKEDDIALLKKNAAIQNLKMERAHQQQTAYAGTAIALVLILLLLGWFNWQVRQNLHKLNQQKNEITTQAQRLQELNTLKDKLFALIGHDLRGPVMNLKSNLNQLLTRRLPHHQFAQQADRLNRTVDALYTTLDNLLHWSALQLKGLIIQPQSVDLSALVMETMELLEPLALQKNITVAIEPRQLIAWTDESQTQIVIRNILQNALKFTPPGGRIEVSFNSSATESVIRIADTGIGMAITDPQQAARTLPRRGTLDETGTGLGLLVCDEFMKRNGGRLQIDSEVGKGTRVTLFFLHASPLNHVLTSSDLHLHETDGFGSR